MKTHCQSLGCWDLPNCIHEFHLSPQTAGYRTDRGGRCGCAYSGGWAQWWEVSEAEAPSGVLLSAVQGKLLGTPGIQKDPSLWGWGWSLGAGEVFLGCDVLGLGVLGEVVT